MKWNKIRIWCFITCGVLSVYISGLAAETYDWQPVDDGYGGICREVVLRGNDAVVYTNGGYFFTKNSGVEWRRFPAGVNKYPNSMLILPDNTLLIAADSGNVITVEKNRTDYRVQEKFGDQRVLTLFATEHALYAGTQEDKVQSIWRSLNDGEDWERVYSMVSQYNISRFSFASTGDEIVAAFERNIVFSADGSANWQLSAFTPERFINSVVYNGIALFAIQTGNQDEPQLFTSTDGGQSWQPLLPADFDEYFSALWVDSSTLYTEAYSVPLNRSALYKSMDNGASWEVVGNGLPGNIMSMAVENGALFAATSLGVFFRAAESEVWTERSVGIKAAQTNCFAAADGVLWAGSALGVLQSDDDGASWHNIGLRGQVIRSLAVFKEKLYASTDSGIYRFDTQAVSWKLAALSGYSTNFLYVNPEGDRLYTGMGNSWLTVPIGIFYTEDGSKWSSFNLLGLDNEFLSSVHDVAQAGGMMFTATDDGLFRFNETDNRWKQLVVPQKSIFTDIVVREDTLIVGAFRKEISYSTDMGGTWHSMEAVPQFGIFGFTNQLTLINDKLYLAASDGLFVCEGIGKPWYSAGLDSIEIPAIVGGTNHIVVGTGGALTTGSRAMGIYRSGSSDPTSVGESATVKMAGLHIAPNPATDQVRFTVPERTDHLQIEIYTPEGRRIDRIIIAAHEYDSLEYNTAYLPVGIYNVRVVSDIAIYNGLLHIIR